MTVPTDKQTMLVIGKLRYFDVFGDSTKAAENELDEDVGVFFTIILDV